MSVEAEQRAERGSRRDQEEERVPQIPRRGDLIGVENSEDRSLKGNIAEQRGHQKDRGAQEGQEEVGLGLAVK